MVFSSYDKLFILYDNLTKVYFSAGWLVPADLQNQGTCHVPTEVESGFGIRDSQVELGQSRLFWDSWTLCKGSPGACSPGKNRNK